MEVGDIHVGKQLSCVFTPQGLNPTTAINPFGFGEKAVCGTGHFNGGVLVGSGKYFPVPHPTASLMVTRPSLDENPLAIAPSIVHIRGALPIPPTPIDVIVGDEAFGPVGVKMFCSTLNIVTASLTVEIAPLKKKTIALEKATGAEVTTGAQVETGVQAQAGAEVRASAKSIMGPTAFSGNVTAPVFIGALNGVATGNKTIGAFDIPHWTKKNTRIRHIIAEGPEPGIYVRGKVKGNVIELPEYWEGLVDPDTITVTLTAFGRAQNLYVKEIEDGKRVIIANEDLSTPNCHYEVWVARWIDPRDHDKILHVTYEGETPADYPGDPKDFLVGGWDYDRRETEW
jgi:hypothetical protein